MPTTPNYGLRYPANTDSADIQGHITNLATDLDNQLLYFNSKQQEIFTVKRDFNATPLVSITNTTTETNLLTLPIQGAVAGDSYRLTIFGQFLNNSGANCTYTTRVKLGGSTYVFGATANISTSAVKRSLNITVDLLIESLTVQIIQGQMTLGTPATNWTSSAYGALGLGRNFANQNLATSKDLQITQAHSVANANITTEMNGYFLERIW
jgi:hypothetical protein